jgi:phospholipase C
VLALISTLMALFATLAAATSPITHVVIVLQENRTFENIFHAYPGAATVNSGIDHLGDTVPLIEVPLMTPWDPAHSYTNWVGEYDAGKMDGFDLSTTDFGTSPPPDFAYAYARRADVQPYWDLAAEGALADEFFADHRSQSFAGHQFPIAGASGPIDAADPDYYASGNPSGGQTCDKPGTGTAINLQTGKEDKKYTSCFDYKTLADLLTAKKKSWAFYIDAASATSSYVSSFAVIKHIRSDATAWSNVRSPATSIYADAKANKLPSVSWVIGAFANSDHPGQTVPSSNGPNWVASVFNAIGESPSWGSTVVILTYDDWGGWFDEVKPPVQFNAFEPGFRVPFVAVSPYAKRGYVSHDVHYMGSILHYVEMLFGLGSLGTSDARSDDLSDVFDTTQKPLPYVPITPEAVASPQAATSPDYVPPGLDPD